VPKKAENLNVVLPPIRCSTVQREDIRDSANEAGLTLSEFARRRLFDRPVVPRSEAKLDAQVLSDLNRLGVAMRSGVGNNLNQLVKDWNSGRDPRLDWQLVHDEMRSTLQELNNVLAAVAEAYE